MVEIVFYVYVRRRLYSVRSVDLVDGAVGMLAYKGATANKGTSARRATNDKGFYMFLLN
jgi:hypothetical protein